MVEAAPLEERITSYYHLRSNGEMVWTKKKVTQKNKYPSCVRKCWEIDHSKAATLVTALVEALVLGAKENKVDDIINRNAIALNSSYQSYAADNEIIVTNKPNHNCSARWTDESKVVNIGVGRTPIHAIANLASQSMC